MARMEEAESTVEACFQPLYIRDKRASSRFLLEVSGWKPLLRRLKFVPFLHARFLAFPTIAPFRLLRRVRPACLAHDKRRDI
jgi:hypothetical protein